MKLFNLVYKIKNPKTEKSCAVDRLKMASYLLENSVWLIPIKLNSFVHVLNSLRCFTMFVCNNTIYNLHFLRIDYVNIHAFA